MCYKNQLFVAQYSSKGNSKATSQVILKQMACNELIWFMLDCSESAMNMWKEPKHGDWHTVLIRGLI